MPGPSIGIDIGGTFTDVVLYDVDGAVRLAKIPSTRADPSVAVSDVLRSVLPGWEVDARELARFVHGTTVATNAVLERKGACTGILASEGFADVLEIGRQSRQELYDLVQRPQTPIFLAPGARRRGVREEISPRGEVIVPLDEESLAQAVEALVAQGVEAVAVCFLFSFVNPVHEHRAADWIRRHHPSLMVSLSSDVDPAFREYERTCVTAFDAYLKPVLDRYLQSMETTLAASGVPAPLQIMHSRGGTCASRVARRRPVQLFLSGPAAGVIGGRSVGAAVGLGDLITVDIGGTSSDIALIMDGRPVIRPDGYVDGYRIRVPMIDVNAVGAGGGSIAWIDRGGGLRVGPESAGAQPGPACYGRGGSRATVTDASVVLGLVNPDYFAGGTLALDPRRSEEAIRTQIAGPLGMSVDEAALGIHRVVNVQMAEGIRLVSVKRGIDPRRFALVPFGGAGPLHATALADELSIDTIVVPRHPGVLSAQGLLSAPVEHVVAATFMCSLDQVDVGALRRTCDELDAGCAELMRAEPVDTACVQTRFFADACYVGQAHYVEVPIEPALDANALVQALQAEFDRVYEQQYGHHAQSPVQLVNLRVVKQAGAGDLPPVVPERASGTRAAPTGTRRLLTRRTQGFVQAAVHDRAALGAGATLVGPAIVEQPDTTVLIEPGWRGRVDRQGILIVTREQAT